jgi:hypothetical protein
MKIEAAIKKKWKNAPKTFERAKAVLAGSHGYACPVCNSTMLFPVIRQPSELWKAHCNTCGSEITIAALMNRTAWRTVSRWWKRQCTPPRRHNVSDQTPPAK